MNHLVINGPESVKIEHILVPLRDRLHFTVLLIADTVVDVEKLRDGHKAIERLCSVMRLVAG